MNLKSKFKSAKFVNKTVIGFTQKIPTYIIIITKSKMGFCGAKQPTVLLTKFVNVYEP